MGKWWTLILALLKAFLGFEEAAQTEKDAAASGKAAANSQVEARLKAELEADHEKVADAADPRVAVKQQLRDDGLL